MSVPEADKFPLSLIDIVTNSAQFFIENSAIPLIVGILGITIGCIAWFWPRQPGPQLAYQIHRIPVLGGRDRKLPPKVEIRYGETKIEHLVRTLVPIWNGGSRIVRGENIVKEDLLEIEFGQDVNILSAAVLNVTNPGNKCTVEISPDPGTVIIKFDFLEPGQGCVVEVFHTDPTRTTVLAGTIREMPRGFRRIRSQKGVNWNLIAMMIMVGIIGLLTLIWVLGNAFVMVWDFANIMRFGFYLIMSLFGLILGYVALVILIMRCPKVLIRPEFK